LSVIFDTLEVTVTRSDTELVSQAVAGERAAFAALVARTAADVAASVPQDKDQYQSVYAVYRQAMRQLSDGAEPTDLHEWLVTLTTQLRLPEPKRRAAHDPTFRAERDLDRLWHDLEPLWPNGKKRRQRPSKRTVLILATVLAVTVIPLALLQFQSARFETDTLIATVYQPDNDDQVSLDPPANGDTPVVPVVPLPPFTVEPPRPQPPAQPDTPANDTPDSDDTDAEPPSDDPADDADDTTEPDQDG
jgi:hypothetical protein